MGCCLLGNWTFAETDPQVKPIFKSSQISFSTCFYPIHSPLGLRVSQAKWGLILEDDILALVPHAEEVVARAVKALPEDWDALFLGYHDDAGRPHPTISREADAEIEVGGGPIQGQVFRRNFWRCMVFDACS